MSDNLDHDSGAGCCSRPLECWRARISGERLRQQQHSGCLRKHTGQGRNRGHGRAAVLAPELQWTIQQTHERTSRAGSKLSKDVVPTRTQSWAAADLGVDVTLNGVTVHWNAAVPGR